LKPLPLVGVGLVLSLFVSTLFLVAVFLLIISLHNLKAGRAVRLFFLPILFLVLFYGGCSSTNRVGLDELSENEYASTLTSQDFRTVSQRLSRSLITLPQIQRATNPPKIAFVSVDNRSNEYIDGQMFLNKMRTELMKHTSGKIVFLDRKILENIKKEADLQRRGEITSSPLQDTIYGADFFLTGSIESISNVSGRLSTQYMRFSFRLTESKSSAIIWEDDYEIKKASKRGIVYSE